MLPLLTNDRRKPVKRSACWIAVLAVLGMILILVSRSFISPTAAAGAPTPTATPIPAGAPNSTWTPVAQDFDGVPFVVVPAGCFVMGSYRFYDNEMPEHRVCLSAYWIGQTEVTNAQYRRCVEAGACRPPQGETLYDDPAYADHPLVNVGWDRANDYARWAGGSLPTEAQWEYAARGPEDWVYPWGNEFDPTRLNFCDVNCTAVVGRDTRADDGYARTAPVGTYPEGASWVGALDMAGNVREWVADGYEHYSSEAQVDPTGPASDVIRVLRGGSWLLNDDYARSMWRDGYDPARWYDDVGFRVALASPP